MVHEVEAEPRIADKPPHHGHGPEADSCLWLRQGRVELADNNPILVAERDWEATPVGVAVMREIETQWTP